MTVAADMQEKSWCGKNFSNQLPGWNVLQFLDAVKKENPHSSGPKRAARMGHPRTGGQKHVRLFMASLYEISSTPQSVVERMPPEHLYQGTELNGICQANEELKVCFGAAALFILGVSAANRGLLLLCRLEGS